MPATVAGVSITVEVSLGGTWRDVTSYVREASWRHGRNDALVATTAGTASVRLDNRDRRFDPSYASGPYAGAVWLMAPIRIKGTLSASTRTYFAGYVTAWPQMTDGVDAWVDLDCQDGLQALQQAQIVSWPDTYARSIGAPYARYGGGVTDLSGNGRTLQSWLSYPLPWSTSDERLAGDSSERSVEFPVGTNGDFAGLRYVGTSTWSACSVSVLVDLSPSWAFQDFGGLLLGVDYDGGNLVTKQRLMVHLGDYATPGHRASFRIKRDRPNGPITIGAYMVGSANSYTLADTTIPDPGRPIMVTLVRSGATLTVYVDGQAVTMSASTVGTPANVAPPKSVYVSGSSVRWSDLVVHEVALTATQAAGMARVVSGEWVRRTDEWASLALDTVIPGAYTASTDGVLCKQPSTGSVLEIVQTLNAVEQGRWFFGGSAMTPQFVSRAALHDSSRYAAAYTYTLDDASANRYVDIVRDQSEETIRNDWSVGDVSASDATSIGRYLRRSASLPDGLYASSAAASSVVGWLLSRHKEPATRIRSIQFDARYNVVGSSGTNAMAHNVGIGERVRVIHRPEGGGTVTVTNCTVEELDNIITAEGRGQWLVRYAMAVEPNNGVTATTLTGNLPLTLVP
jgi:hypothetical protein